MDDLAQLGAANESIACGLAQLGTITGYLVLSTCNRFEMYLDVPLFHDALESVTAIVAEHVGNRVADLLQVTVGDQAVRHAMAVTSGLESMAVGECEISGQVRSAMGKGRLSPALRRVFQHALTTSKAVAHNTGLGAAGRSLVAVALDAAAASLDGLAGRDVLLIGTGSYARIVVAELVRRDVGRIVVHSPSGRGVDFSATHPVIPGEVSAVGEVDLVVACSGSGGVLTRADLVQRATPRELVLIDLCPRRDITADVTDLPGVELLDLDRIGPMMPTASAQSVSRAWDIVDRGVATYSHLEGGRAADPAVVAMRTHVSRIIEAEYQEVARRHPPEVAQAVARSLRRVSNALLHTPSIRAHELARTGDLDDYRRAMQTLFGIEVDLTMSDLEAAIDEAAGSPAPAEA